MENIIQKSLDNVLKGFESTYYEDIAFRRATKNDLFPLFIANKNQYFNKFLSWDKQENIENLNEIKVGSSFWAF